MTSNNVLFFKGDLIMTINYHCGELLSPALKSMAEKKLAKLEKYGLDEAVVDIHMAKEGKDFAMKLQLQSKEYNLLAKSSSSDMYKNIDDCLDKLISQINKK